jgi:ferric-dicitrate binding protein FerR (iron transport regulator)
MNDSPNRPTRTILFTYFAQQATPLEREQVANWLKTPEGLEDYFTVLDEWERQHPQFQPDLDRATDRFRALRQQPRPPVSAEETPTSRPARRRIGGWPFGGWLSIAASLVLLGGLALSYPAWYYQTWSNGPGEVQTIALPDGSGVLLGTQSTLRYARFGFSRGTRRVWLTGEAQFRVTHQTNHQRFTVQMPDQTTVEVLGTVFVVNSRRNTTRVMLETGRITLTTPRTNRQLLLAPGDVVTVGAQHLPRRERMPKAAPRVTWQDHKFVFENTPLSDVATQLQDVFGVRLSSPQPEVMQRAVTGTFEAETAQDLLDAVALMMNLNLQKTTRGYVLTR